MNHWYVSDSLFRIAVLAFAAVAIPTIVRKRIRGRAVSYTAVTAGLVVLVAGEVVRLLITFWPQGWLAGLVNVHLPTYAGGYLLMLVGFFSLMYDMGRTQVRDRQATQAEHVRAEEARLQQAKLRAILDGAADYAIITCDLEGMITSYSSGGARILGWTAGEVVGKMSVAQLRPGSTLPAADVMATVRAQGRFEAELPMTRKDGTSVATLLTITPLTNADGCLEGYVGIAKNITEMREAREALRHERDFVKGILETNEAAIMSLALEDGRITLFNRGAERMTGYRRDEVMGRPYREVFLAPEDRPRAIRTREDVLHGRIKNVGTEEHFILIKSGERRLVAWTYTVLTDVANRPTHAVMFGHDVTAERQMVASLEEAKGALERANQELERLATTDYLTGLFNRRQANILFTREMARSRRHQTPIGVALLDLDHFKVVNDTHGHEVGDAVLKHVADQLRERLRASDVIARYGGEEFLIVLPETGLSEAARLADLVRRRIQENVLVCGDARIHQSTSLGVTVLEPGQDISIEELVRRADEAMYCAKNLGGNRVVMWNRSAEGQTDSSLVVSEEVEKLRSHVQAFSRGSPEAFFENVCRLAETLEARNHYTVHHSANVAQYAAAIAREMGFSEADIATIHRAAMLHDLGKAAIPDDVLWKDATLSESDWALISQHPAATVKILDRLPFLHRETFIVRYHHERPDGRGYPDGLMGAAIPMEARILAVADALEAMTHPRPYRGALALPEAIEQLHGGVPHQFDADVVAAATTAARKAADWPLPVAEPAPAGAVSGTL